MSKSLKADVGVEKCVIGEPINLSVPATAQAA